MDYTFSNLYNKLNDDDKNLFLESILEEIYDSYDFEGKECVVCGEKYNVFFPFNGIKQILCPNCSSISRQRFVYYYLTREFKKFTKKSKFMAFSPEILHSSFQNCKDISYIPVDFKKDYNDKMEHFPIDKIPFEDESIDVIYELNHIVQSKNDLAALKELYRVIKPASKGGFIILSEYIDSNKEKTTQKINGLNINRSYGLDFFDKVKSVGFDVKTITPNDFNQKDMKKYGIYPFDKFFVCTKLNDKKSNSTLKK